MSRDERSVAGFSFEDDEQLLQAEKEARAIEYISDQIDMEQPQMVLHAYQQLIHQDLFHTQVGYDFLKKMQGFLYAVPEISQADITDIPVRIIPSPKKQEKPVEKKKKNKKGINQILLFLCLVLTAIVIAMFAITITSDNITILNYKEKLIDQYAYWEESLDEREQELDLREQQLDKKQNITQEAE